MQELTDDRRGPRPSASERPVRLPPPQLRRQCQCQCRGPSCKSWERAQRLEEESCARWGAEAVRDLVRAGRAAGGGGATNGLNTRRARGLPPGFGVWGENLLRIEVL